MVYIGEMYDWGLVMSLLNKPSILSPNCLACCWELDIPELGLCQGFELERII